MIRGERLSKRQAEIARLKYRGYNHKRIAGELGISTNTVASTMTTVRLKLGVSDYDSFQERYEAYQKGGKGKDE